MFEESLKRIQEASERVKKNLVNNIPFYGFPNLAKHVPGIAKGFYYIVTASSGIGKTQFTKKLFVTDVYKYVKEHPEKNIKLKIIYFALEESKEEFMLSLISNRLYTEYNIDISSLELRSFTNQLPDEIINKIVESSEYFKDFEKYVEVVDTVYNPTGLYKYVKEYANNNGTHHYKEMEFGGKKEKIYSHYVPHDDNEFVIVITDHVSLLQEERDPHTKLMLSKHSTIGKWSADYCKHKICKEFGYTVVNVQQQAAEKEKQEFYKGNSIEAKLEPSLDGLADNKLTQRDAYIVLGLFAPDRYEVKRHLKYEIDKLGDNYRSVKILKNRVGVPNLKSALFFNGKVNDFFELPHYDSVLMEEIYHNLKLKK